MIQSDKLEELKSDPRMIKQLQVMLSVLDEAFKNNMANYIKLVQIDALKEFNRKCDEEGVGEERRAFSHEIMDEVLRQVNDDLKYEIMCQFDEVKKTIL